MCAPLGLAAVHHGGDGPCGRRLSRDRCPSRGPRRRRQGGERPATSNPLGWLSAVRREDRTPPPETMFRPPPRLSLGGEVTLESPPFPSTGTRTSRPGRSTGFERQHPPRG